MRVRIKFTCGLLVSLLVVAASGCQSSPAAEAAPRDDEGASPPLARATRTLAYPGGTELGLSALLDKLATADAVFLGETHLDDVTHRVEAAIYEGLLRRRGGKVVLAMEMFATDVQAVLDDYTAGRIDEAEFLRKSSPWGNYATGYRAMIERARRDKLPVVGSNAPQMVMRKVSMGGAAAFAALTPAEKALMPSELLPNTKEYWQRFDRATRGHAGGGASDPAQMLYSGQSLWDNTMGWSCVRARERHPGWLVLHVNGGFHTAYADGTAGQFKQRSPGAKVATVQIDVVNDLAGVTADSDRRDADYVVFAQSRARGLDEGYHAITAHHELRYRLEVPDQAKGPLPLLIWLGSEGLRSDDGLALWEAGLGEAAIIAAVEPPYGQLEADLSRGGKWLWGDTHVADLSAMLGALAELRSYLQRHFPVDPQRVVVAGEGEGATVAAACILWGDELDRALAFAPRGYRKLAERGLPDDERADGDLTVFAADADATWWQQELGQHTFRKLQAKVVAPSDRVSAVRAALGLAGLTGEKRLSVVVGATRSSRARAWQALAAARVSSQGVAPEVVEVATGPDAAAKVAAMQLAPQARALAFAGEWPTEVEQALVARGVQFLTPELAARAGLPPAPGPFGGTTMLVVPKSASPETRAAWKAVAERNPMQRYGRFYRLELAFEDDAPSLADALAKMVAARRSNAVVVPAVFCAEASFMQALQAATEAHAGQVDIAWLPGLGGRVAP
jgi:uncharacterized iron-regulated protein/dienelactone hydrolase